MAKKRSARSEIHVRGSKGNPEAPAARILANLSKQAPHNSYSPLLFYDDNPFVCLDCGKEEIWTAKQQQWWYEVAKGPIYSRAVRCRACRKASREKHNKQPFRHIGQLMKLVRTQIEPSILAAGFTFESRNKPRDARERVWLDYQRNDQLFSFAFERVPPDQIPRLIAELLEQDGTCQVIATAEFDAPRTRADIMTTVSAFTGAVIEFMEKLDH